MIMPSREELELQHERVVRADIELFRERAQKVLAGEMSDDEFRPFRLRDGIYGQRQPGVQMVRVKIPSGLLTSQQIEQLGNIADEFGGGKGHLTTRQNLQYHFIPLAQVPDVMHKLADVRLTNREACFNTVRNVTCCPWAGIAPDEVFDVRYYAQRTAYAFIRQPLTQSMPRKFKITFCGCGKDCTIGAMNDIGLRAVIKDGKRGFRMVIAGGLGPLPTEAALLHEFVPEEDLTSRIEAVLRVFNEYGNRKNKNTARLKFVMRNRGFEWLAEQIEKAYQDILANGGIPTPEMVPEGFGGFQSNPAPLGTGALLPVVNTPSSGNPAYDRWLETNVKPQKQTGYAAVLVRVEQGNLTGDQFRALGRLASDAADGLVRIMIEQNLMLAYIPLARLPRVYAALEQIGLAEAGVGEIDDIITCPGAYSCNLALTKTMNLGSALQEAVRQYDDSAVKKLSIKASGCPNACGQHWIGDIGFYGNARKIDGKEVPYYQMLLGGGYDEEGVLRFGLAVQSIPARLAPVAIQKVLDHFVANRIEGETFRQYVVRTKVETFRALTSELAKPAELFPEIYQDWGDDEAFSLKLGRGECAA
jgi:sulfite reductase beta subunit-like hemoprotein